MPHVLYTCGLSLGSLLPAETVLALLRNPDYCIYGLSSLKKERGLDAGEDRFNEISMQERGKFKEETLVNFGGRTKRKPGSGCVLAAAQHWTTAHGWGLPIWR